MNQFLSPGQRFHDPGDAPQDPDPKARTHAHPIGPLPAPAGPPPSDPDPGPQGVPESPQELIAMQRHEPSAEPGGATIGEAPAETRLAQLLAQIGVQGLNPWETQQIALALIRHLEAYHQEVLDGMQNPGERVSPAQVACWAIDGDRLRQCLQLLESITLL